MHIVRFHKPQISKNNDHRPRSSQMPHLILNQWVGVGSLSLFHTSAFFPPPLKCVSRIQMRVNDVMSVCCSLKLEIASQLCAILSSGFPSRRRRVHTLAASFWLSTVTTWRFWTSATESSSKSSSLSFVISTWRTGKPFHSRPSSCRSLPVKYFTMSLTLFQIWKIWDFGHHSPK